MFNPPHADRARRTPDDHIGHSQPGGQRTWYTSATSDTAPTLMTHTHYPTAEPRHQMLDMNTRNLPPLQQTMTMPGYYPRDQSAPSEPHLQGHFVPGMMSSTVNAQMPASPSGFTAPVQPYSSTTTQHSVSPWLTTQDGLTSTPSSRSSTSFDGRFGYDHQMNNPERAFVGRGESTSGSRQRPDIPRHEPARSVDEVSLRQATFVDRRQRGISLPHYNVNPSPPLSQTSHIPNARESLQRPSHYQSRVVHPPSLRYELRIRQQPHAARACGFGERDRRVIDPPPIIELQTYSLLTGQPEPDHNGLTALHCTVINHITDREERHLGPPTANQLPARRLMGNLVASPNQVNDENGVSGTFFVFPDLSCRTPGKYRLQFRLLRIDPRYMVPGNTFPCVARCNTEVFTVYAAKDFPGMRASSALLKALRSQGVIVGVKKGSEAGSRSKGKSRADVPSEDEEDDEDEAGAENAGAGPSSSAYGSGPQQGISSGTRYKKRRSQE